MLKSPPYVAGEIERSKGTHPAVIARGPLGGGDALRAQGVRVESLAIVESMTDDSIAFRN